MNEKAIQRKLAKAAERDKQLIDNACRALLASPDGRKFCWWLFDSTRFMSSTFTGNALSSAFQQGEQNIGNMLAARLMAVDAPGFVAMMKERVDEYGSRKSDLDRDRVERDDDGYRPDADLDD